MANAVYDTDVFIAGGSYAGLALGLALSQAGAGDLRVTVASPSFEAAGNAGTDIRASALSRASLNMLDHLGLWRRLALDAQTVAAIELTDSKLDDAMRPTRLRYALFDSDPSNPDRVPKMAMVENGKLGSALLEAVRAAPAVTLMERARVKNFAADLDGVTVHSDDGRRVRARLLVAADGARSELRALAGIGTVGHAYDQTGIVALIEPSMPHGGVAIQHFLPAGPFALLPMTDNRICVTWTERAAEASRIVALDAAAFAGEIERRCGGTFGALKVIGTPRSWPLTLSLARSLVAERFVLVGDAAHSVHPLAGQGLNLGFRDVAALTDTIMDAAKLGLDIGSVTTLERYERWRRFDTMVAAGGFDLLNRVFATHSTLARSARGAALSLVDALPGFKSWLVDEASGQTGDVPTLLRGM